MWLTKMVMLLDYLLPVCKILSPFLKSFSEKTIEVKEKLGFSIESLVDVCSDVCLVVGKYLV